MLDKPVKIAILDAVPESYWADDEGITDAQKFVDLLAPENPQADFDIYFVSMYEFPESLDDYDAFLFTGSPASVHDDDDWIQQLSQLLVDVNNANKQDIFSRCL